MKIYEINSVKFTGKIIDAHMHTGNWYGQQYTVEQLDAFIKSPLSNGDTVEKVLVSNLSAIDQHNIQSEIDGNIEMLKIAQNNPKIAPLAVCQPKTGSVKNIEKLFKENPNKFVGLKFHPDGHEIMATDNLFNPYLLFAEKKQLPCLFHCGIKWENGRLVDEAFRYSSPEGIYQTAKKIPTTPVILAHLGAGGNEVHSKTIKVLLESIDKKDANLFADISWVDIDNPQKPTIIELITKLKEKNALNKILFGSDAPIGEFTTGTTDLSGKELYDKTIIDIKSAIKNNFPEDADNIIDKIFYDNANNLFFKNKLIDTPNTSEKPIAKIIAIVLLGLTMIGATLAIVKKHSHNASTIKTQETTKSIVA